MLHSFLIGASLKIAAVSLLVHILEQADLMEKVVRLFAVRADPQLHPVACGQKQYAVCFQIYLDLCHELYTLLFCKGEKGPDIDGCQCMVRSDHLNHNLPHLLTKGMPDQQAANRL